MKERIWTKEELKQVLLKSEIGYDELFGPGGDSVLITERGARVLGVFADDDAACPFWIHPNIERILSGEYTDWYDEGVGSMGGDRLWLSPEQGFSYEQPETFDGWFCPLDMDPGKYEKTSSAPGSVSFVNKLDLMDYLSGNMIKNIIMKRTFSCIANPHENLMAGRSVTYAGVKTVEEVIIDAVGVDVRVQPWVLTQIPAGSQENPGTVIVPVKEGAEPIGYFGEIPSDRLHVSPDHVSFRIDALHISKLGVKPEDIRPGKPAIRADVAVSHRGHPIFLLSRKK